MRPSDNRTIQLWPAFVLAVVIICGALSFHTEMRLNNDPPGEFVAAGKTMGYTNDSTMTEAYWRLAVNVIQWRYPRASILPESPPVEFAVPGSDGKVSPSVRTAYWNALRRVWLLPENWHTSVEHDFLWPVRAIKTLVNDANRVLS